MWSALIETEEGPHLMSHVTGVAPESVAIGQRVTVRFGEGDDAYVPSFQPVEANV